MGKVRVEDLKKLAELYNSEGKGAVYALLRSQYGVKNPYYVLKRMCEHPELSYDEANDDFKINKVNNEDKIFMSMDELCSPVIAKQIGNDSHIKQDVRPIAMEKLIHELIGDRLLELSKYITIDSLSKRIIVDRTTLLQDGYQLITN